MKTTNQLFHTNLLTVV